MCIWYDRWFVCSQHLKVGRAIKPQPIANPEKPWLSWKHGEELSPEDRSKLGLSSPEGYQLIRHKQTLVCRCAGLYQTPCLNGPRETRTELYSVSCTACSGNDGCTIDEEAYTTDRSGHGSLTVEGQRKLTHMVDEYWNHLIRYESALLNRMLPQFPYISSPNSGLDETLQKFRELYAPGLCTEDGNHVTEGFFCESCPNQVNPETHNGVRAMRVHESEVLYFQDSVEFQINLTRLQDTEDSLKDLQQDRSPDLPQAWLARGNPSIETKLSTWAVTIEEYLEEIVKLGEEIEDSDSRQVELTGDWGMLVAFRAWYAQQLACLILHDTGLSNRVLGGLFRRHVLPMLEPWPFTPLVKTRFEDITGATPITQEFVRRLDAIATDGVITHQLRMLKNRQHQLLHAIAVTRAKIISNTTSIDQLIELFVRQHIIDRDEALAIEYTCACCGDEWTPGHHVAFPQQIVQMPCCKKPLHVRPHIRNEAVLRQKEDYCCPMCRGNVKAYGWFDIKWTEPLHQTETLPIGFLYLDTDVQDINLSGDDEGGDDV